MRCASGSIPTKLAARGLTPLDVTNALAEQNVEVPAGQLGRSALRSAPGLPDGGARGRAADRSEPVREHHSEVERRQCAGGIGRDCAPASGSGIVLLRDVGRAELGAETYNTSLKLRRPRLLRRRRGRHRRAAAFERECAGCGQALQGGVGGVAEVVPARAAGIHRGRYDDGGFGLDQRGGEDAGRGDRHRHHRHLPVPAGLARDAHSGDYHPGVADRDVCVHQALRVLDQLADAVRNYAGHRPGGRRRDRRHRERAAPSGRHGDHGPGGLRPRPAQGDRRWRWPR